MFDIIVDILEKVKQKFITSAGTNHKKCQNLVSLTFRTGTS